MYNQFKCDNCGNIRTFGNSPCEPEQRKVYILCGNCNKYTMHIFWSITFERIMGGLRELSNM